MIRRWKLLRMVWAGIREKHPDASFWERFVILGRTLR